MKKVIALLLSLVLIFCSASCDMLDLLDLDVGSSGSKVTFSGLDRKGNYISDEVFSKHEVTMINFWEPWCRPCVGEMPALEMLYENYSGKGLYIIGVYSDTSMEDQVDAILSDNHISYPIMKTVDSLKQYKTGYVPTTIFVDKNGCLMDVSFADGCENRNYLVGGKAYGDWSVIVNRLLPSKTEG